MKTAIVKLSGKAIEDFTSNADWLTAIAKIKAVYDGVIIVHGAGNQISEWSGRMGFPVNFVNGQRVTDENVMSVATAVQSGLINGKMIAFLNANGINAVGLTGIDNNLFIAEYSSPELGFVGIPKFNKNINWIQQMMLGGITPVFSSICRDANGNLMNVNADTFTNALAIALQASTVFFVSDVDGIKLNGSTKFTINEMEIRSGIQEKQITGGMIPKVESCMSLMQSGIRNIWIGKNMFGAMNTASGMERGTWIVATK